jgi:hypothetical protein
MFGYAAFAQPTFAGLGGASYYVNISEALTSADNVNALRTAFGNITENLNSADLPVALTAIFNTFITENINFLETPIGFAWVKIDNTEGTQWVLINNTQRPYS